MSKYFTKVVHDYWTPKNKLQKEAKVIARNNERLLIEDHKNYQSLIQIQIKKLNESFPRCKPLILYIWVDFENDIIIEVPGVFKLTMFKVKFQ